LFRGDYARFLIQLGFTKSQANLYLTLIKIGKANAKTLAKHSGAPRQAVYRTLQELLEMGFVEKTIALPCEFRAVPIQDAMSILSAKKANEYRGFEEKISVLLQDFEHTKIETLHEEEHRFIIIQGKERIIQFIRKKLDSAQESVDVASAMHRWLQILHYCFENYEKALKRGVEFRLIIAKPITEEGLSENVLSLTAKPNFQLRLSPNLIKTNAAVFDGKEAIFNFYPPKLLAESPIIWTNHPSFIEMCQSNFEKNWLLTPKLDKNMLENPAVKN
jgi:sugar-specific transcriptional regulator TrmB